MTGFLLKKGWMLLCPFAKSPKGLAKIPLRSRKKSGSTVPRTDTILLMSPPTNVLSLIPAGKNIFAVIAVLPAQRTAVPVTFVTAFVRTSRGVPITVTFWTRHLLSVMAAQKRLTAVWINITTEQQPLTASTGRSSPRPEPVSTSQKTISRFWMNW